MKEEIKEMMKMKDMFQWFLLPVKFTYLPALLLWKVVTEINCVVAHGKYRTHHQINYGYGGEWIHCDKCKADKLFV